MVISRSSVILTKTGYKICEIGEIPEEWDLKPFGEILQIRKRKTSEKLEKLYTIPMDLIPENGTYCEYKAIESNEVIPPTYCEAGDILLPKITPSVENGKLGIVPNLPTGFALATSEVYPIVPGNTLTNLFTFYLLKMDLFRKPLINSMVGTTGRQRVPKDSLFNLMFPVPTITEQNKITDILSTADDAIHKVNEQIALTEQLKKGLMQKLLTRGIGHTRFKKTEIGEIPEEWNIMELKEFVKVEYGKANPRTEGKIPLVGSSGIFGRVAKALIESPTIVIGRKGTAGAVWDIESPSWPSDTSFYLIYKNDDVVQKYLYEFMSLNKLSGDKAKTTLPSLQIKDLENFIVPIPPLPEQQKIAEILSAADSKLELLRRKNEKLKVLKKGLMNDLLTGKVRVKV